jgi:photosystem II reaction center protein PsbP
LSTLLTIISVLTLSSTVPITTAATTIIQQEGDLAQTNDDNTFKIYQNPIYGIQIQHPSDWRIDEGDVYADDYITDIVSFIAPIRSDTESYAPSLSISIDNLPPNLNENLYEYLNRITNDYDDILKEFEVIESDTNSILAGKPAYKLVSTDEEDGIDYKNMEIGAIIGDKVYFIEYDAEEDQYSDYLPTIQKMMDSFQLDDTNPTSQESPLSSSSTIEPETQGIPNEPQMQQHQQESPSIDFDIPQEQEP